MSKLDLESFRWLNTMIQDRAEVKVQLAQYIDLHFYFHLTRGYEIVCIDIQSYELRKKRKFIQC